MISVTKLLTLTQELPDAFSKAAAFLKGGFSSLTADKIKSEFASIAPILKEIGEAISPAAGVAAHAIIGFVSVFADGNVMKDVQAGLNAYLAGTAGFVPLDVDGKFGPKSNAALVLAETKAGLPITGVIGSTINNLLIKALQAV